MPLARVVSFDGVSSDRMAEMQREMEGSERPDNVPAGEIIVLHDPEAEKSLVIVFFETDDDYQRDAGRRHARPAHVGFEVSGRLPHDGLAQRPSPHDDGALRCDSWSRQKHRCSSTTAIARFVVPAPVGFPHAGRDRSKPSPGSSSAPTNSNGSV